VEKMAELPKDGPFGGSAFYFKRREIPYMIAIILNYRPLLYPFCFINNSGDQGIPSELGYIPLEEFGRTL
jgi:hypothetical protein